VKRTEFAVAKSTPKQAKFSRCVGGESGRTQDLADDRAAEIIRVSELEKENNRGEMKKERRSLLQVTADKGPGTRSTSAAKSMCGELNDQNKRGESQTLVDRRPLSRKGTTTTKPKKGHRVQKIDPLGKRWCGIGRGEGKSQSKGESLKRRNKKAARKGIA